MDYFDYSVTEEELNEIEKYDCLFSANVISLDNKKNRKYFNSYAYEQYLKAESNSNTEDNKGGADSE